MTFIPTPAVSTAESINLLNCYVNMPETNVTVQKLYSILKIIIIILVNTVLNPLSVSHMCKGKNTRSGGLFIDN